MIINRIPQKYVGRFVVTTNKGRTISTAESKEYAEGVALDGRKRIVWQWFERHYVCHRQY